MRVESNSWTGEFIGIYTTATATATGEQEIQPELPPGVYIECGEGALSAYGLSTSRENDIKNEWDKYRSQIISFGSLREDWDEAGGEPPSPELIDRALEILSREERSGRYPPPVRAVPTNAGGIVIEWQFDGIYLEAEICDLYQIEWMKAQPDQPIEHWEELLDEQKSTTSPATTAVEMLEAAA